MAEKTAGNEEPIIIKKIIKKSGHAAAHGGAWKVAYADFVTAMMCLFLLLWLINVDPSSKSAISSYFKQPTQSGPIDGNIFIFGGAKRPGNPGKLEGGSSFLEFQKLILSGNNKKEVQKRMQLEMKEQLEMTADEDLLDKIEFNLVENGILIEIKDTDTMESFKSGSAALTEQATTIIDKLANVMRDKISPVIVAGHTDSKQFNYGNYDNWNLSTDRAIAIKTRLIYGGIDKTRFARIEGYADTQPKDPDVPLSPNNRRMTILLLQDGELETLKPAYIDEQDDLGKEVKEQRIQETALKQKGEFKAKEYQEKSAGRPTQPLTLEELKRKKEREAFRKRNPTPTGASSGGGHGAAAPEGEAPAEEAKPAASSGGHGGGH